MSKYKAGDKFEIEVISESVIEEGCYLTRAGIVPEGMLDMLKKIEPEVDWSKVEVDTPILVKFLPDEEWKRRHFARYEDGKVYAWDCGLTSWSLGDEQRTAAWNYAKLAEVEE